MNLVMAIGEHHMLLMSAIQLSLMCITSPLSHIVKSNLIAVQDWADNIKIHINGLTVMVSLIGLPFSPNA